MSLIQIEHNPSRCQLIVFGVAWLLCFALLGAMAVSRGWGWAAALWTAAAAVPTVGVWVPGFLRIVYIAMAYLAFPIGFLVSHLMLAVLFYAVLTPIGLMLRLAGMTP